MRIDHYHDFYELYFYLGNRMRYFIGNKTYYVNKYDLVLIDKFTYHRTSYEDTGTRERILCYIAPVVFNIIYNAAIKQKVLDLFTLKTISFKDTFKKHILDTFMNRIMPEFYNARNPSIGHYRSRLMMIDLLLEVVELLENKEIIKDNIIASPQEKRVSDIVDYINLNYRNYITLNELCRLFYVSKYYLCHIFKDITGISIIEFINRKRLAEAKKLLKYSDYSITDISGMVGFNSVSRFISLFREEYGKTPNNFRKSGEYNPSDAK
jgi:AraC-like DNA-binding protein